MQWSSLMQIFTAQFYVDVEPMVEVKTDSLIVVSLNVFYQVLLIARTEKLAIAIDFTICLPHDFSNARDALSS